MSVEEQVVLVDSEDQVVGSEEKMKAHRLGLLHRAFSVFLYRHVRNEVEILLQQRQSTKYHCGGLWTNTCCSHPRLGETIEEAGRRRLQEEMSIDCPLRVIGRFQYRAPFDNGLIEHELDYVLVGEYNDKDPFVPNPDEVQDTRWVSLKGIQQQLKEKPNEFTPWFPLALELVMDAVCCTS